MSSTRALVCVSLALLALVCSVHGVRTSVVERLRRTRAADGDAPATINVQPQIHINIIRPGEKAKEKREARVQKAKAELKEAQKKEEETQEKLAAEEDAGPDTPPGTILDLASGSSSGQ